MTLAIWLNSKCAKVNKKGVRTMVENIITATNLTKQYGGYFALERVNMTIRSGEIYGLIGENGAGKTTLMRIIGNLARPSSGSISLFGKTDAVNMNKARKQIGFLIEMPALYPDLSAKDNLKFYCSLFNITEKSVINKVLKEVSLQDTGDKKVVNFSMGMRQRLGLAIALINDPKFLVLDEPMNGLDPSGIVQIREILINLAKEKGVAILISSHILSELQLMATRLGFIHKGRMLQEIYANKLTESDERYICLKTSHPSRTAQILKDSFHIDIISSGENEEILIPNEQIALEEIISELISHNLQILSVSIASPTLENYYMNLIRGESK